MQNIPVFYHVPKCGGTFFWEHAIVYSMYRDNPNPNIYDVCFSQIKTSDDNFFVAAFYMQKQKKQKYLIQTIDHKAFLSLCQSDILTPYAFCIVSNSKFKYSKEYIDKIITEYNMSSVYITLLRNPISRIQSIFYYKTDFGYWDDYYGTIKQNTFHDYIYSDQLESNWIIHHTNEYPDSSRLSDKDFEFTLNALKNFHVVGILENMSKFEIDIAQYNIRYRPLDSLFYKNMYPIEKAMNKNTKSKKRDISQEDTRYLQEQCKYDIALYNYFKEQNEI
jgi:hypothetical protein